MAQSFGTPEWARAFERQINESSEYRNAGARWGDGFNGNMLFAFEADPVLARAHRLLIRLRAGACQGAEFVDGAAHPEAAFVLREPFSLWKDVLERRTLAATAILTGKMKVEGDKMLLLRHTAAHRALVHCAASVETLWPA